MLTLKEIAEIQHHYEIYKNPRSEIEAQIALDAMNKIFDDRHRAEQPTVEFEAVGDGRGSE